MNLDITTKQGYDIATALRGPDLDEFSKVVKAAKLLTTCVVRYLAGMELSREVDTWVYNKSFVVYLHRGAYVTTPEIAAQIWEKLEPAERKAVLFFLRSNSHFSRHIRNGLEAIGTPEAMAHIKWMRDNGLVL